MMQRTFRALLSLAAVGAFGLSGTAVAHDPIEGGDPGASSGGGDAAHHMRLNAMFPTNPLDLTAPVSSTNRRPTSSDMAFWGDLAYVGNYNGFRIFDIGQKKPRLVSEVVCVGAQGDPSVTDTNGDGRADLLVLSVDRTMTGPDCTAVPTSNHADPAGWEGLRLFDVSDPRRPRFITGVYQDCGSHTNTLLPSGDRLFVLNSSYPLRPGPTCGPQQSARDALHGVVQVVEIDKANPAASREVTELPVTYPGDADNKFTPSEHGLSSPALVDGMRACHDLAVFVELGLVGAACAEQAQLWKIDKATGLPDSANPVWVYDQPNVDFWHSATFSWDGRVANFIDESFGGGCPTTTVKKDLSTADPDDTREFQTGNMFFLDTRSGGLLSEFRISRVTEAGEAVTYCSSHLGNVVPARDRYLLANAYYRGGSSVIDFTDPRRPREIAFHDRANADTWSTYWYERKASQGTSMPIYANDGVHDPNTGGGFEAFTAWVGPTKRTGLPYLNPQVQERVVPTTIPARASAARRSVRRSKYAKGRPTTRGSRTNAATVLRRLGG